MGKGGDYELAIIDVSRYLKSVHTGGSEAERELLALASQLREACEEIGFFYLVGFEEVLPRSLCMKCLDAARQAHAIDKDAKSAWLMDDADSGYMPKGASIRWLVY